MFKDNWFSIAGVLTLALFVAGLGALRAPALADSLKGCNVKATDIPVSATLEDHADLAGLGDSTCGR